MIRMEMNGDSRDEFEEFKARSYSCGCLKISSEQLATLGGNADNIPASSLLSPTYQPRGKSVSPCPTRRRRSRPSSRYRRSRSSHDLKLREHQSYTESYREESYRYTSDSGEAGRIYRSVLHVGTLEENLHLKCKISQTA